MTNKKNRKLSNIIIHPSFQFRFSMITTSLLFVCIIMFGYFSYSKVNENYELLVEHSSLSDEVKLILKNELHNLKINFAFFAIIISFVFFLINLYYTHRIAGPMHKLITLLNRSGKNDIHKIYFRKSDEFKDVADAYNQFIDRLK